MLGDRSRLGKQTTKALKEFILLYKSHPCLWQVKSKDYQNWDLKEEAYNELVEKLREIDPKADRTYLFKEIHNIRSAFYREQKRLESKDTTDTTDQPPKLWFYDLLTFIADQVNSDEDDDDEIDEYEEEDEHEIDISMIEDEPAIKIETAELVDSGGHLKAEAEKDPFGNDTNETIEPTLTTEIPHRSIESMPENSDFNTKLIKEKMFNGKLMKVIPSSLFKKHCEDKFDYFGKHIAFSLREMDGSQSVIAQKLISEIIYRGHLKQLDTSSVQNISEMMDDH